MFNSSHLRLHNAKIIDWKNYGGEVKGKSDGAIDLTQIEFWWESYLDHLSYGERMSFLVIFCFFVAFGFIGNILTIYVTIVR